LSEFIFQLNSAQRLLNTGTTDFNKLPALVKHIDDCIDDSAPDSTPGIPLNYYNSKKSHWMDQRVSLITVVIDRCVKLLNYDFTDKTATDYVRDGICDPIYLFIKDEPHKKAKLLDGRFRLISGVSIVDNIIERFLYSTLNKFEIEVHNFIPFKPGMGLHDEGQIDLYCWFQYLQNLDVICSTDVSGWDWSVCGKLLMADHAYRCELANSEPWRKLSFARFNCLSKKILQLPSGEMFEQTIPGVQASGSYNTSSGNSHMRFMLASIVGQRHGDILGFPGCQMGDDALEKYYDGMDVTYASAGYHVKGVELMPQNVFSFCSTLWDNSPSGFPESWKKTLFRFVYKSPRDPLYSTYREQFCRDMRNHPDVAAIVQRVDDFISQYHCRDERLGYVVKQPPYT
jgi:hypothetical protein